MILPINLKHFPIGNNSWLRKMSITGVPFSLTRLRRLVKGIAIAVSVKGLNYASDNAIVSDKDNHGTPHEY